MRMIVVLVAVMLGGCASYSKPGGDAMKAEYDRRECARAVELSKDYPTRAESFTPGGIERSAARIEQLQDACMAKAGYRRQ